MQIAADPFSPWVPCGDVDIVRELGLGSIQDFLKISGFRKGNNEGLAIGLRVVSAIRKAVKKKKPKYIAEQWTRSIPAGCTRPFTIVKSEQATNGQRAVAEALDERDATHIRKVLGRPDSNNLKGYINSCKNWIRDHGESFGVVLTHEFSTGRQ
ncbi:hypothetical protein TruAng_010144 [Truncatella angustata]|nr:hypothetical protein TruAng_010144 [Truncatella angustata]